METLHGKQAGKYLKCQGDYTMPTSNENKEILKQSIDKCAHQVEKKEIIKQSTTSNESQI